MLRSRMRRGWLLAPMLALAVMATLLTGATAGAAGAPGAVYTLTNDAGGNAVAVYTRHADGSLTYAASYPTGGLGNGGSLGSQGALTLSADHHLLLAVNAGSNSVTLFQVNANGLTWLDTASSNGVMPVSVTISGNLVYVLNAGGAGNIAGFRLTGNHLTALRGTPSASIGVVGRGRRGPVDWTQPLSNGGAGANVGAAQVQFTPDGGTLVVTEKATNLIDSYAVGANGLADAPTVTASQGATPFGFAISARGTLVVSEAGTTSVSSYVFDDGALTAVTASTPTQQAAPCWVVVTANGKYAYVANAAANSIGGYLVASDGSLTALNGNGVTGQTGGHPSDLAISANGPYLYSLDNTSQQFSIFAVNSDGSLTHLGSQGGLPASAAGVAAR